MSSDGKYQAAAVDANYIYISSDYGNTWVRNVIADGWQAISMSSDGKYITAVTYTNPGKIYISRNYGQTWVIRGAPSAAPYTSISMSSDGKYQTALRIYSTINFSSDYGNNWTAKAPSLLWRANAMSSNGKYQVAVSDSQLYVSIADEIINGSFTADNIYGNNIIYTSGNQTISGVKTFLNSGIFSSGIPPLGLLNNPLSVVGSGNSYLQLNIQNRSTGLTATADLVITANNGTDSTNYINLGINNSGYNDSNFSNGSGLDGYLFVNGGSLDIGTQTPNTNIEFHVGGTTLGKVIGRITESGLNIVSGNLTVGNTGVLLSGSIPFTMNFGHIRNTAIIGDQRYYFGPQMDIDPVTITNNERRRVRILQDCYLRRVSWTSVAKTAAPTPHDAMTGYFKNFGNNSIDNDNSVGIQVTSGISIPSSNTLYNNSTGTLNIPVKSGDYVSFYYQSNWGTAPTNLAVNVDAYFYV
jgi:hypothetical protein